MRGYINCVLLLFVLLSVGCSTPKNVSYMVDAETIPVEVLSQVVSSPEPVVMPGDLLNIEVSAVNMSAVIPFNKGKYVNHEGDIVDNQKSVTGSSAESSTQYYLVDKNGYIDFPILGKLHIGAMNKAAIETLIQGELYPKYLKEVPSIDIRFMNFKVTVLGAVKSPGVVQSSNERLSLLEALALAGDLDIKGRRDNIKLIRTNADGTREVVILDINSKEILLSPYFNLQQNDVIYVEPNKSLAQSAWQMNPAVTATIAIVGGLSSVASLVVGIVNLSK